MVRAYRQYNNRQTPQSEPVPGRDQAPNSAGGFTFALDDWARLDRFLVLGSDGGSYYVGERALTVENAQIVLRCLNADGLRTVARISQISISGRAAKNDPAIFALALAMAYGDAATKRAASALLPGVCRIGTHLFHFAEYVQGLRGWGRSLRTAVSNWYESKDSVALALQVVKYQQRDGWSHRDLLALSHPGPTTVSGARTITTPEWETKRAVYDWVMGQERRGRKDAPSGSLPEIITAFEQAQRVTDKREVVKLILAHNLPREAIPTQFLMEPSVWDALLTNMPMEAMVRNLGNMAKVGLLTPNSDAAQVVGARLVSSEVVQRSRIHPLKLLVALRTYQQGHGARSSSQWTAVPRVLDALDRAFYLAFRNVESTGTRYFLGLDVSGSMGSPLSSAPSLSCRDASAALALVTMAAEEQTFVGGFTAGVLGRTGPLSSKPFTPLAISARQRLDDVVRYIEKLDFGGTDCALPMLYATENKISVDAFVIYTDSETWAGSIHPFQALRQYREKMGIPAKLIVVGMVSNGFTIADPNDVGMLDVVGFDTDTPAIIADFARAAPTVMGAVHNPVGVVAVD